MFYEYTEMNIKETHWKIYSYTILFQDLCNLEHTRNIVIDINMLVYVKLNITNL